MISLIVSIFLIFAIGLTTGYCIGYFQAGKAAFPDIKEISDVNPGVSTIKFLKVQNGLLKGEIAGQKARLAYSTEKIEDLEPGASFEIPLSQVTLGQYYSAQDLPAGIQFIASTSGKYYYSVLDPRAFKITPKNRLYFKQASEARARGFLAPK